MLEFAGRQVAVTPDALAKLPAVKVEVAFGTEHGPFRATFEGPLLWTVLLQTGAVDAAHPRNQVRQSLAITGRDGYGAALALGEIAPAFEGKQVVLATRQDGKALAPDHFRLAVPGDQRGGRSVRDVVKILVSSIDPAD